MTRDLDIVVELGPGDADKISELFGREYFVARDVVAAAIAGASMFNVIHNESA